MDPGVVATFLKRAACNDMMANVTLPQEQGLMPARSNCLRAEERISCVFLPPPPDCRVLRVNPMEEVGAALTNHVRLQHSGFTRLLVLQDVAAAGTPDGRKDLSKLLFFSSNVITMKGSGDLFSVNMEGGCCVLGRAL